MLSDQLVTFTEVLEAVAVKVLVPSERTVPFRSPLTTRLIRLSEPSLSFRVMAIGEILMLVFDAAVADRVVAAGS